MVKIETKEGDEMKKVCLIIVLLACMIIAGCSHSLNVAENESLSIIQVSSSESKHLGDVKVTKFVDETSVLQKATEKSVIATKNTSKSEISQIPVSKNVNVEKTTKASVKSTKKVEITTAKPFVTNKHETTKKPTTTKHTTTKKETTTKKPTTTQSAYFCDEGGSHHSCNVGPIGWVSSYQSATNAALNYIADNDTSGNFTVKECWYCGKYTASVTLD